MKPMRLEEIESCRRLGFECEREMENGETTSGWGVSGWDPAPLLSDVDDDDVEKIRDGGRWWRGEHECLKEPGEE